MRKAFIAIGLLVGTLGLSACGLSGDRVVYQYSKTSVLFDYEHIRKVVYTPGKMKLYYCGMELNESEIRCYDAAFEDLGDDFSYSFKNGVLTVNADFADRISGLTIDDANRSSIIYHLRYLDSPQFAWMADIFWLDAGWQHVGDKEAFYTEEERNAQERNEDARQKETLDTFALLEGTWVSEDGLQKYVFSAAADASSLTAEQLWYNEAEQNWVAWSILVKHAFQAEYYNNMGRADGNLIEITLSDTDPATLRMTLLYDPQENVLRENDVIYHWTASED